MAIFYIVACAGVLVNNAGALPDAVMLVIGSAFTGHAATGGFVGAGIMLAIQSGVARGSSPTSRAWARPPSRRRRPRPIRAWEQGLVSMTGAFIDTIIICTMTGLTLVVTGVCGRCERCGHDQSGLCPGLDAHVGQYLVSIGLLFFAFTTILGWNYYGERCTEYLFGVKAIKPYRLIYLVLVASGAFLHLDLIWLLLADIVNGLMAVPNLIGLIGLRHVVIAETRAYFSRDRDTESEPEPQTADEKPCGRPCHRMASNPKNPGLIPILVAFLFIRKSHGWGLFAFYGMNGGDVLPSPSRLSPAASVRSPCLTRAASSPCQPMAARQGGGGAGAKRSSPPPVVEAARHPGALHPHPRHQQHGLGQHGAVVILARRQPALGGAGHLASPDHQVVLAVAKRAGHEVVVSRGPYSPTGRAARPCSR